MSEAEALRERWHVFLGKIEERYGEVAQEARETLPGLCMPAAEGGVQPYRLATQALRSQLFALAEKVDATWRGRVEPAATALDPDLEWRMEEELRGEAVKRRIFEGQERLAFELDGMAAERVLGFADVAAARERRCAECSATLEGVGLFTRATYVACPFCAYTNTYEPPTDVRELGWFAVDALARARTLDSWDALQAEFEAFNAHRSPAPPGAAARLREAHDAHHGAYLAARIELCPELTEHLEEDRARHRREIERFLAPRT